MAVLLNQASKVYAQGPLGPFPITVAVGITLMDVSLTREAWPAGQVATVRIDWSDGTAVEVQLWGGTAVARGGGVQATSDFSLNKPAGITTGTVSGNVIPAAGISTAILVTSA
jgi:hypothetical protein